MSILIKRLPEKKWEDITIEDVNNAIVFGNNHTDTDAFYDDDDTESAMLGRYIIRYIPSTYNNFDADRDALTTLFAGNYARAVCIPGLDEDSTASQKTINALREIAWNFVAGTSDRAYACNRLEEEEALKSIGYTRGEWVTRVGDLLMNMILGL